MKRRLGFPPVGPWLDTWGPRASNVAQVGLSLIAGWGLIYTVIPLYRLSVADNELARKTIELEQANKAIAKAYAEKRRIFTNRFALQASADCVGPLWFMETDIRKGKPPWNEILAFDTDKCANEALQGDDELKELTSTDFGIVKAELALALRNISAWKTETRAKCEEISSAAPEAIPPAPPVAPGSFTAQLRGIAAALPQPMGDRGSGRFH